MSTSRRLTQVFKAAKEVPFDDASKLIFFSDCHRGDNSFADDFAHNQNLYYHALNDYFYKGFTYIEVGDGDELWKNRNFSEIREAHSNVFWLLQKFHRQGRFHMIYGNHDIVKKNKKFIENSLSRYYSHRQSYYQPLFDQLEPQEGLILKHSTTGSKIFVVHGHQGDLLNDRFWPLARFLIRYIVRPLELMGFRNPISPAKNHVRKKAIERNIIHWVKSNSQMVIAGHTHRPMFSQDRQPPYFNTGSCVHPRCITGVEIQNQEISLIKWCVKTREDGSLYVAKDILAGPRALHSILK